MQVVTVRMGLTGEHLAHIEPFQPTTDGLYFLQSVNFKTSGGECVTHLLGSEVEVNKLFQPFIRNIH